MVRISVPENIEKEVLLLCRRRCCICFGLYQDLRVESGQVAHLDHDNINNDLDNLAFLCLIHHDQYDSTTSQSKGLKAGEVKHFRSELHSRIGKDIAAATIGTAAEKPEVALIFKESPLFTTERKVQLSNEVNAFYHYLAEIGFDLPKEAPPLGVGAGTSLSYVFPGTVYDASMFIPGDDIDNLDNIRCMYSLFLFSYLFRWGEPLLDPQAFVMRSVGVFADYYRASFVNRHSIYPGSSVARLETALWDIRRIHGKHFVDRAMFFTFKRWGPPLSTEVDFDSFFTLRFLIGEAVIDNLGQHDGPVRSVLRQRGLLQAS
jgi:hypothetical protein